MPSGFVGDTLERERNDEIFFIRDRLKNYANTGGVSISQKTATSDLSMLTRITKVITLIHYLSF